MGAARALHRKPIPGAVLARLLPLVLEGPLRRARRPAPRMSVGEALPRAGPLHRPGGSAELSSEEPEMRRLFLMIGMCVVFARPSGADVLTFEGLTTTQAVDLTAGNQGYGGFTWDAGWYLYRGDVYHPPGSFGDYGIVNNFGNDPLGFSAGRPFSVTSLRIARW